MKARTWVVASTIAAAAALSAAVIGATVAAAQDTCLRADLEYSEGARVEGQRCWNRQWVDDDQGHVDPGGGSSGGRSGTFSNDQALENAIDDLGVEVYEPDPMN